jgi:tRNA (cytidine32/uridine32-2'-O)-methyltransferase
MCLEKLVLVNPKGYPNAEATARASGAHDLLANARVCATLDEALEGCRVAAGTSARLRNVAWPQYEPRECAERLLGEAGQGEVALVFGRESSGLTNAELDRCQYLVHIPANQVYSSLNLSQAVQVLTYELLMAERAGRALVEEARETVTLEEMEGFYRHLEQAMEEVGFSDPRQSNKLQRRLRRLFFRARPDKDEINILRGFLSAAQGRKSMKRGGGEG